MDAIREALYQAEEELSMAQEIKRLSPDYTCPQSGRHIGTIIADLTARIQELRRDLHGDY